jgi:hypothetical protein
MNRYEDDDNGGIDDEVSHSPKSEQKARENEQ